MERQEAEGGLICVVSHSACTTSGATIRQTLLEADAVYGWDYPPEQRKPRRSRSRIWALQRLSAGDLLMIDDLKPGYDMALSCG